MILWQAQRLSGERWPRRLDPWTPREAISSKAARSQEPMVLRWQRNHVPPSLSAGGSIRRRRCGKRRSWTLRGPGRSRRLPDAGKAERMGPGTQIPPQPGAAGGRALLSRGAFIALSSPVANGASNSPTARRVAGTGATREEEENDRGNGKAATMGLIAQGQSTGWANKMMGYAPHGT